MKEKEKLNSKNKIHLWPLALGISVKTDKQNRSKGRKKAGSSTVYDGTQHQSVNKFNAA